MQSLPRTNATKFHNIYLHMQILQETKYYYQKAMSA